MNRIEIFLGLVEEFRQVRALTETTVSGMLFNDGKRIGAIRDGSDVGTRRLDKAERELRTLIAEAKREAKRVGA